MGILFIVWIIIQLHYVFCFSDCYAFGLCKLFHLCAFDITPSCEGLFICFLEHFLAIWGYKFLCTPLVYLLPPSLITQVPMEPSYFYCYFIGVSWDWWLQLFYHMHHSKVLILFLVTSQSNSENPGSYHPSIYFILQFNCTCIVAPEL